MAWIGEPGKRFEFKCPSAVEVTPSDLRVRFVSMTGRVSITDLSGVPTPRQWVVEVEAARPQDVASLEALSSGEFGPGPFQWIPPAAETLQLLGRGAAVCLGSHQQPGGVVTGGPVLTADGWAGRSLVRGTATHVSLGTAPALPGRDVAVRVWAAGSAVQIRVDPFAAAHSGAPATVSDPVDAGSGAWVTATVPAGFDTVGVTVDVLGATTVTRPSVTWDAPARLWTPSKASMSVSIQPVPATVLRATGRAGEEILTRHAFEIQEIG